MNFYIDPAFYVVLAVAIVPAAILGFTGHRMKYYGLAASLVFLLLLFGENLQGMVAFLVFLAVACAATFWVLRSWQKGEKTLWKYRIALVAVIAPLVIYKIGAVFDHNRGARRSNYGHELRRLPVLPRFLRALHLGPHRSQSALYRGR